MSGRVWSIIGLLLLALVGRAQDTNTVSLRVDVTERLGPISPFVYGVNHGPWAPLSVETTPLAAALDVNFLRFPGGRWGDQFNLKPMDIDIYMFVAEQLNAEPSITVRMEGGTPEQAAELVLYTNIEKDYGVRYWAIGNEPDLFEDYTPERASAEWRAIALAMEAVDPTIQLMGPEVSQYPPTVAGDTYTNVRREWVRTFLEMNGDMVDVVTIHRYPFPTDNVSATSVDQLMANPPEWDVMIPDLRALIRETTGRNIPIGIMEINSHWSDSISGPATNDSFANAIWWADVLGRLIRQRVEMVTYFNLRTTNGPASYGLVGRMDYRPTGHVYRLYQKFGTELVQSASDSDFVSITAALTEDGAVTLMIVNRNATDTPVTIDVGASAGGVAEAWRLDPAHNAESIEAQTFSALTDLTLPAYSVTLYRIAPAN